MSSADISVVVPAKDAAATLQPVLEGLLRAGFSADDVVLVDDGSTDGTHLIAQQYGVYVHRNALSQGAAAARNAGVEIAKGALILFVDADVVVHPDVRARLVEWSHNYPQEAAVFGSYDDKPSDPRRISRIRNLLHHHNHQTAARSANTFWTGIGAVRRDAFEDVGGFDPEQTFMEDIAFGYALSRKGYAIGLDPRLQGTHLKYWSLAGFLHTDLYHRAIPWSRLIRRSAAPKALNADRRGQLSVSVVGLSLLSLIVTLNMPFLGSLLALSCIVALAGLNFAFLRRLLGLGGLSEVAVGLIILWLHFLMAGLGFARVLIFDRQT